MALQEKASDRYWPAFFVCAAAALAPIWAVKYLPMVDLPQHAAQIFLWLHYDDPRYNFSKLYQVNWFTPYLFGYAVARVLAAAFGVLVAVKIVVSLAVVGLPLATQYLLSKTGGERWWALLGFPLAFGFSFHWGFLNYLVAVPLGIVLVALAWERAQAPSFRNVIFLTAYSIFLFFAHALVFGLCTGTAVLLFLALAPTKRQKALGLLIGLGCLPVAIPWLLLLRDRTDTSQLAWLIDWDRILHFPGMLVGYAPDWHCTVMGLFMLACPLVFLRWERPWVRAIPAAAALAYWFVGPRDIGGVQLVSHRFAVFAIPFLLLALPRPRQALTRFSHAVIIVLVLSWSAFLLARFREFDREAAGIDFLIDAMDENRSVISINYLPWSDAFPTLPYHIGAAAWYQTQKGGVQAFSYAATYQTIVRYRPGAAPAATPNLVWLPKLFDWKVDGWYDYFIVRAEKDLGPRIFREATEPIVLEARCGNWWLYRRKHMKPEPPSP